MNLPEPYVAWTDLKDKRCDCMNAHVAESVIGRRFVWVVSQVVAHYMEKNASSQPDLIGHKALAVDLFITALNMLFFQYHSTFVLMH